MAPSSATATPPATHWQSLADGYDPVMGPDPAMSALRRRIVERLPDGTSRVLDLGTGTGILLELTRCRFPDCHLVGLDPAPAMLEEARPKLPGAELLLGSADALDLPSASFDAVISNFALHHLEHEAKRRCAEEIHRVLVPGGLLVFGDQYCPRMGTPADPEWVAEMLEHFSRKARHFLDSAGTGRMLLQVKLMPRLLTADGEVPCTVDYWLDCLDAAGFAGTEVEAVGPELLLHHVVVARKERP